MNVLERLDSFRDEEFRLGPRIPLKQQLELDKSPKILVLTGSLKFQVVYLVGRGERGSKDDDSLRRWKEQLLGQLSLDKLSIDGQEPEVKILTIGMSTPGSPDVTFALPLSSSQDPTFVLKEGSLYSLKFSFSVQKNLVPGLTYVNKVWKSGLLVDQTHVMLGTFAPQIDPYTYIMEEEETPSGALARGSYTAKTKFVDDDNICYLEIDYSFQIVKES